MKSETKENLKLVSYVICVFLIVVIFAFLLVRLLGIYGYYTNNLDDYCKLKYGSNYLGSSMGRYYPTGTSRCIVINENGTIIEYYSTLNQYRDLCKTPKFLDFKHWKDIC